MELMSVTNMHLRRGSYLTYLVYFVDITAATQRYLCPGVTLSGYVLACLKAGLGTKEEFGHLRLRDEENFCMGGPGVIFSRETLIRVAPHVNDCLQHLMTNHEDVELGRCIHWFAGVTCTWSYEVLSAKLSFPSTPLFAIL